jgi:ribosomal protein S18 acetylase RimI-like enzyme
MEIKKAGKEDFATIQHLVYAIWPNAYGTIISGEQIDYMLTLFYSDDALMEQMQNGHQFIFAVENDTTLGFASFSAKSNDDPNTFRLHKLYVLPQQQTKGVGSFLLDNIYATMKKYSADCLELNVNKYNSAKEFYLKKGFAILREEVIDIGEGYVMDDYVMRMAL